MKNFALAICATLLLAGCATSEPKAPKSGECPMHGKTMHHHGHHHMHHMHDTNGTMGKMGCGCMNKTKSMEMPKDKTHANIKPNEKMPCDATHASMGACKVEK